MAESKRSAPIKRYSIQLWFIWGLTLFMMLSAVPVAAKILGYNFIPSPMWAEASGTAATLLGVLSFVLFIWYARTLVRRAKVPIDTRVQVIGVLLLPFFMAFAGPAVLVSSVPSIFAIVVGKPVEFAYRVQGVDENGGRRCGSEVTIADLPFLTNDLCRVPSHIRKAVHEDASVVIGGRGTKYGVWVQTIRRPWEEEVLYFH